jgi:hypothetical protein
LPISRSVVFVHACLFCGWSRQAATATIIAPQCEGCGCVLVSSPEGPAEAPALPALGRPSIPPALAWLAKGVAVAAVMAAGAKVGYDAGGPWLAGAGFSVTGLFSVIPLVPESSPG